MRKVGSRELKNRFGRYMREVKAGRPVLITERGEHVATISPKPKNAQEDSADELLDLMEKQGLIRRGRGKLRNVKAVRTKGKPASQIIIENRD